MAFAQDTAVPIGRSQEEIRTLVLKNKAVSFMAGESDGMALVAFEMHGRRLRFNIKLAKAGVNRDKKCKLFNQVMADKENRRLWRCMLLAIKSKLECVNSGISTFEQEFLANILLPNNKTVGEEVVPQLNEAYESRQMPPLLGYGG